MARYRKTHAGGGFPAIFYTLAKSMQAGPLRMWKKMTSRNACKTCAVGMGGQLGGMVNEARHFPEVCKKSLQAQAADMIGAIDVDYFEKHDLDVLLALSPKQAEDAGRLIYPVLMEAGEKKFKTISWEKAMAVAAESLHNLPPEQAAFYASGRSSNEAGFLLQSFARVFGSNNVMNCSFYCHQASGVALKMAFGTGTATVQLDDVAACDLIFLIGTNPASNHPRMMTQLADLRARGGKVVVVNPIYESGLEKFHVPSKVKSLFFGTKIASTYIQPLAGGDVHFLVGVLKALIESKKINQEFLQNYTHGADAVLADARQATWEELVLGSGVSKAEMEEVAEILSASRGAIFAWAMGVTHHASGVDNVLAISNLALATGNVGKPGAGLLPLRGHSNVQGMGSIGFTPDLKDAFRKALAQVYGKSVPDGLGLDTYAMMDRANEGKIKTLICLGGNLWGSNPDSNWAAEAMQKIGTTIYLSTKLNPGHFYGRGQTTLILPVLARDEETQATTQESMFNFVRLSDGGEANVKGMMRAESEVVCDLADRVLGKDPVDWLSLKDHGKVRKLIAQVVPGWQEIGEIDQSKREFTVAGRVLHSPQFPTEDGRALMHRTPLPALPEGFRLMTIRSEGQFNTVVYEETDFYRGVPHRFCVIMSPEDAGKLNLQDGQRVTVRGEAGKMDNIEVVFGKIKQGVLAMYYPEANVLIAPRLDSRSKTPSFKSAPVWIEA